MKRGIKPSEVNAYPLERFSTKLQTDGNSSERQLASVKYECAREGWTWNEDLIVADLGISAFRGLNFAASSELGKFMEAARQQKLRPNPVLLAENADRFSRAVISVPDQAIWNLTRWGVDVRIINVGLHLTKGDENNTVKRTQLMWEFDRAHKDSKRRQDYVYGVNRSKIALAQKGIAVDFGAYMPSWVEFVKSEFKLNEAKVAIIRRIVRLYRSGMSTYAIARLLNKEKVPTLRYSATWSTTTIKSLLTSRGLVGDTALSTRSLITADTDLDEDKKLTLVKLPRYYPRILEDNEFDELQANIASRATAKGVAAVKNIRALFRNCTCHYCGSQMYVSRSGEGDIRYWSCLGRMRGCECGNDARTYGRLGVRTDVVEMAFFVSILQKFPAELLSEKDEDLQRRLGDAQAKIAVLDAKIEDTTELIGDIPVEALKKRLVQFTTERIHLQKEMDLSMTLSIQAHATISAWNLLKHELTLHNEQLNEAIAEVDKSMLELDKQLEDQTLRRKLVQVIPSLIGGLVIDAKNGRFAIRSHTGKVGEWTDVSAAAVAMRRQRVWTPDERKAHGQKISAKLKGRSWTWARRAAHIKAPTRAPWSAERRKIQMEGFSKRKPHLWSAEQRAHYEKSIAERKPHVEAARRVRNNSTDSGSK